MNSISKRILAGITEKGLSYGELSKLTGVPKSALQRYATGETLKIPIDVIEKIAPYLNVSAAYLMGWEDDTPTTLESISAVPYNPTHRIPVLGRISAGLPLYAEEHVEGWIYTELNGSNEYFALRVQGDSMNNRKIDDGDIVIIRRQPIVENGEIAVVLVDGEDATIKQFFKNGTIVTLVPHSNNTKHMPQVYNCKETKIEILGRLMRNVIDF